MFTVAYGTVPYRTYTLQRRRAVRYGAVPVRYRTVLFIIILAPLDRDWVFGHVDVYEIWQYVIQIMVTVPVPYRTVPYRTLTMVRFWSQSFKTGEGI